MHQWDIVVGVSGRERSHPISSAAANANASTSSKNTSVVRMNLQTLQQIVATSSDGQNTSENEPTQTRSHDCARTGYVGFDCHHGTGLH
jgi:hypothetical protein